MYRTRSACGMALNNKASKYGRLAEGLINLLNDLDKAAEKGVKKPNSM